MSNLNNPEPKIRFAKPELEFYQIEKRNWDIFIDKIKSLKLPSSILYSIIISLLIPFAFYMFDQAQNSDKNSNYYYLIGIISFVGVLFLFYNICRCSKETSSTKIEILKMAETFIYRTESEKPIKEENTESSAKSLHDWIAKMKSENRQGVDFKEIPLDSKTLKMISFKVVSNAPYWRAGIKFEYKDAFSSMPILVTDKSFLLHIGKQLNGEYITQIYQNGIEQEPLHKLVADYGNNEFTIRIEKDKGNYLRFFVNNILHYDSFINGIIINDDLFYRAFLAAWADQDKRSKIKRPFEVTFSNINYYVD